MYVLIVVLAGLLTFTLLTVTYWAIVTVKEFYFHYKYNLYGKLDVKKSYFKMLLLLMAWILLMLGMLGVFSYFLIIK